MINLSQNDWEAKSAKEFFPLGAFNDASATGKGRLCCLPMVLKN
jgi:hypothetical protein